MTGMREAKRGVRDAARAARTAVPDDSRPAAAVAAAQRLLAVPEIASVRTVLGYAATAEELDPAPAIEALRERGARIAYPRVCGPGEMTVHWAEPGELEPGFCGLLEPGEAAAMATPEEIDLVIVPGVAFDAQCHRLGMGSGFYDRFLVRMRQDALAVGFAFDEQLVDAVPCEEHDARLDAVVTPTRTIRSAG